MDKILSTIIYSMILFVLSLSYQKSESSLAEAVVECGGAIHMGKVLMTAKR